MTGARLPACFPFLIRDSNAAVDSALLEAFEYLDPIAQRAALSLLVQRSDVAAQTKLLALPAFATEPARSWVADQIEQMPQAVRQAVFSGSPDQRTNAIDLIVGGAGYKLAYILAEALTLRDVGVRRQAAGALFALVERWLASPSREAEGTPGGPSDDTARHLDQAISSAIRSWDFHHDVRILDAAIRLSDRCFQAVVSKLEQPRTTLGRALEKRLERPVGASAAAFLIRALRVERLRDSAAACIGRTDDPVLLRSLLACAWLLEDPAIRHGCRRIRGGAWLEACERELPRLSADEAWAMVQLLAASGQRRSQRFERLEQWMNGGGDTVHEAILWQLVRDRCEASTSLLEKLCRRLNGSLENVAERELALRSGQSLVASAPTMGQQATVEEHTEHAWQGFDRGTEEQRASLLENVPSEHGYVLSFLRAKLAATDDRERLRGLHFSVALGLIAAIEEQVYRLAKDADPVVRSHAVGLLAQFPGVIGLRILQTSVDDRDPRVQANAIEALDQLDTPTRAEVTNPKLTSKHARVRANAIKSLLRLETPKAAEALLDMLADPSQSNRCSALWVVQRLQLFSMVRRIEQMARVDPTLRVRQRASRILEACSADAPRPASYAAHTGAPAPEAPA